MKYSKVIFQDIEIYSKIFTEYKNNVQILLSKTFHILNLPKKFKEHEYRITVRYSKNLLYMYIPKNYNALRNIRFLN